MKNNNLPNLKRNVTRNSSKRLLNSTHMKLNTINSSLQKDPKARVNSSMDKPDDGFTLLETPSVKNVLSNEKFSYDQNDKFQD